MAITQTIHLTQHQREPFPIIDAVQNDTGRSVKMIIDDVTLTSGNTGALYFKRADNSYYNVSATLSTSDNSFTADLTQGLTQPGTTECQLRVTASSKAVSTFTFLVRVQPAVDGVPSVSQLGYTIQDIIDYAEAAEESASHFVIEDNFDLASDNAVENAVVTALKDNLEESLDRFGFKTYIGVESGMISYTTGEVLESQQGVLSYTDYIDVSGMTSFTYKRMHSINSTLSNVTYGMAFYDSGKNFISGERAKYNAPSRYYTNEDIEVPDGAVYARFTVMTDLAEDGAFGIRPSTESIGEEIDSIHDTLNFVNGYFDDLWTEIDMSDVGTLTATYPRASDTWEEMSTYGGGYMISRDQLGSAIKVTGGGNSYSVVMLLTSNSTTEGDPVLYADVPNPRINIKKGITEVIQIPAATIAPYVWISTSFKTLNSMKPQSVSKLSSASVDFTGVLKAVEELRKMVIESQLNNAAFGVVTSNNMYRDVPKNRGVLNAYKKAQQFLKIQYVPKAPLVYETSGTTNIDYYATGSTITGMVYSSTKECDKMVGTNVSLRTFMTAINNVKSVLYTECVTYGHSASGYGNTYYGRNCATYFGTVCSGILSYALGFAEQGLHIYTNDIPTVLTQNDTFEKVYDNSAQGVQLMDVIWKDTHVRLITDIYRDDRGRVVEIHVVENGHPTTEAIYSDARPGYYTLAQFDAYLADNDAQLYRYRDLYKNTHYEQSPFVAVEDETPQSYTYNDDICTYMGDYPCVADWEKMYLNYNKGSYTQIQVFTESGTLKDTINLTANSDTVQLSSYGAGKFKARLHSSSADSDYTHWEVIDTNAEVTNGKTRIEFSSTNGKPTYVRLAKYDDLNNGKDRGVLFLTDEDRENGYAALDYLQIIQDQGFAGDDNHDLYAKVYFQGDYGVCRADITNCKLID